ncbi:MAG: hypothetical protein AB7G28_22760 [Pirellulales bacterium]
MAQSSTGNFERREDLGMRFDEFDLAMNRLGFIAHRVMPIVPRGRSSGKFPRIPIDQYVQRLNVKRNPDGTYNRSKREFSDDTYDTAEYGLEAPLDDRTVERYNDLLDAEVFEGEVIENSLLMEYEIQVATLHFNAGTYAGRTSGVSTPWSTVATATPVTDVNTAITNVRASSGVKPNAVILNDVEFRNAIRCSQVIDTLKYQGYQDARPGEISQQALAISFNVDEVIVASGMYNTKEPGVPAALGDIWPNDMVLVARVAKTRNPMERCIGRTIMWDQEGAVNGDSMGVIAERYYEEARRGGVLRRRTDWGLKNLFLNCGYLLTAV